jgi:hypothetical protein
MRTAVANHARRQVSAPKSAGPLGSSFVAFRQGIPSPRTLPVNWRGLGARVQHGRMAPALDIPPHSYGSLIATTVRIVTWNVWGLYGPWQEREAAIVATLQDAHPDIVVLTESWAKGADSQCVRLARPLDMPHYTLAALRPRRTRPRSPASR